MQLSKIAAATFVHQTSKRTDLNACYLCVSVSGTQACHTGKTTFVLETFFPRCQYASCLVPLSPLFVSVSQQQELKTALVLPRWKS